MIHFFDTSALLKRYVREPGSQMVKVAFHPKAAAVARIAHAEALAAVARAHRERVFSEAQRDQIFDRIDEDVRSVRVVEPRAALVATVRPLVARHPLRGYDAVQLASALAMLRAGSAVTFWSADARLCEAARAEGLRTVVPS